MGPKPQGSYAVSAAAQGTTTRLDAISNALKDRDEPLGVWLTLTMEPSGTKLSGVLFALSPVTQVAVLQTPAHGQTTMHPTLHLVSLQAVSKAVVGTPGKDGVPSPLPTLVPVTHVPLERLEEKERLAVRAEKERLAKLGVGVSDEAQGIFDALSKTLPTAWRGTSILVMDEILIPSPYKVCSLLPGKSGAGDGDTATLARVQKVLDGERARRSAASAAATKK